MLDTGNHWLSHVFPIMEVNGYRLLVLSSVVIIRVTHGKFSNISGENKRRSFEECWKLVAFDFNSIFFSVTSLPLSIISFWRAPIIIISNAEIKIIIKSNVCVCECGCREANTHHHFPLSRLWNIASLLTWAQLHTRDQTATVVYTLYSTLL